MGRAAITVKLHGGPFHGQSAVAEEARVGLVLNIDQRSYRIATVETIPGWRESFASAIYVPKRAGGPKQPTR